jgi:hypothetical protein
VQVMMYNSESKSFFNMAPDAFGNLDDTEKLAVFNKFVGKTYKLTVCIQKNNSIVIKHLVEAAIA